MNGGTPFGTDDKVGEQDIRFIDIVVEEVAVPKKDESPVKVPFTSIVIDNVKLPYKLIYSSPVAEFKLTNEDAVCN